MDLDLMRLYSTVNYGDSILKMTPLSFRLMLGCCHYR